MAFKKIKGEGILPGPRAVFISGYTAESHTLLSLYVERIGLLNLEIVPCREDSIDRKIIEVLQNKTAAPLIPAEKLPPVVLWSGISHSELDTALGSFHETGLMRPIFATTTERNLEFTVKELLRHLLNEQKSIREAMSINQSE